MNPHSTRMVLTLMLTLYALVGVVHAQSAEFHSDFDAVLAANVRDGFVDYPGIAADPRFSAYIDRISSPLPAGNTPAGNLAFWINAYNALSIKGILDGHSPKNLLGRYKFFKRIEYTAGGKVIDLYDLERKVIIPLGEPRIHFAIVCSSYSCPSLRSEAYVASRLEQQLDEQTRVFLNDPSKILSTRNARPYSCRKSSTGTQRSSRTLRVRSKSMLPTMSRMKIWPRRCGPTSIV